MPIKNYPEEQYKRYQFKFRLTNSDRELLMGVASPVQWRMFCIGVASILRVLKDAAPKQGSTLEDAAVRLFTSPNAKDIIKPLMMVLTDPDFKGMTDEQVDAIVAKAKDKG